MTSVIHNQLTEITGLNLLGGGKKRSAVVPEGKKKWTKEVMKQTEVRQKQTNTSRLKAFIFTLKVSNTTQSLSEGASFVIDGDIPRG